MKTWKSQIIHTVRLRFHRVSFGMGTSERTAYVRSVGPSFSLRMERDCLATLKLHLQTAQGRALRGLQKWYRNH